MNNKGSLLLLTIIFVLAFTLLGLGTIFLSGMNNRIAQRQALSDEAFWLADGAIERAKSVLSGTLFAPGEFTQITLGNGVYDISSVNDTILDSNGNVVDTYRYQWKAESRGLVGQQTRGIRAVIKALDNQFIIKTRGIIKDMDKCPMASVEVDCSLIEEHAVFSLDTYFKGLSKEDIKNMADHTYTDPANAGDIKPVAGITVINLINKSSINLTADNIIDSSSVFLIIDTSASAGNPGKPPSVKLTADTEFNGIIWIIGEAEIVGNAVVKGTFFVEGDSNLATKLGGNGTLDLDVAAVEEAVSYLGQSDPFFLPGDPEIIAWEEI